jgi:hypothetical protein
LDVGVVKALDMVGHFLKRKVRLQLLPQS